jgi:hypothetical protein
MRKQPAMQSHACSPPSGGSLRAGTMGAPSSVGLSDGVPESVGTAFSSSMAGVNVGPLMVPGLAGWVGGWGRALRLVVACG